MTPGRLTFGIILLAAGESGRMGRPKLLLPWADTTILGHQLHLWQRLGPQQVAVVRASRNDGLRAELHRLGVPDTSHILNPQPELGMFNSIRCAAQWKGWQQGLTHWVIALGDQPHLKFETLQALLQFSAAHPEKVCQPRRLGRQHHPVVIPRRFFNLLDRTRAGTLREFLGCIPEDVTGCDLEDSGLGFDIDTPQDYQRALSEFAGT